MIDNSREKANILKSYFASVYTKELLDEIPKLTLGQAPKQSKMSITVEMVKRLIHDLNVHKSPGPVWIHPGFMQELSAELCIPLTMIFEKSIESAQLPDQWKVASVSAIFKKGNKKLASNYRPVSITSIVCRTFEKIIRDHIVSFLMEHGLLSNFKFGFMKGRSTTLQLLNILNDWTHSMENKNVTDCVYMDYQKAFDKVPHGRLLTKLKAYNLCSEVISWIKEYLTDKSQCVEVNGTVITGKFCFGVPSNIQSIYLCVEINGKASEWLPVTSGIPQGSVLGPLLFLIYINDLLDNIISEVYMYADDTKLYREIKTIEDQRILQKDLDTLTKWSEIWLLKFHPEKCFNLTIGIREGEESSYHMMIDNVKHEMTKIEEIKDIGVIMDSNLKFEKHINVKIVTANKILGIIRRTYMFLNKEIFLPLYKALVRSHFDYAMSIWNPHMIKFIESVESVQRRATKLIPKIKNLTYPGWLKALNLPTLSYRRVRGDMFEVYKIISTYMIAIQAKIFLILERRIQLTYLLLNTKDYIQQPGSITLRIGLLPIGTHCQKM